MTKGELVEYCDLKKEVQKGNMSSKEASRFICGHLGYMKYANTRNLEEKLFYIN